MEEFRLSGPYNGYEELIINFDNYFSFKSNIDNIYTSNKKDLK